MNTVTFIQKHEKVFLTKSLLTRPQRKLKRKILKIDYAVTCCVPLLGGEDLLEGEDLLLGLLELGLPLLPLALLLLGAQLLEVTPDHRVSRGVDVLKNKQFYRIN